AGRTRRQPAEQLAITVDELRPTGIVVALGASVALTPARRIANLEMLPLGNSARHGIHAGFADVIAPALSAAGLAALPAIACALRRVSPLPLVCHTPSIQRATPWKRASDAPSARRPGPTFAVLTTINSRPL